MDPDSRSVDDPASRSSGSRTLRLLIANGIGMVGFVVVAVWNGDLRIAIIAGVLLAGLAAIGSRVLIAAYDL
ncbi:hypothetical protein SAMN05192561_1062 [Halopenitus malekzadehii]|uniref:Uncharacterized protein n=1 Tax=Halopenitus malekzadehii TaxID=1267564 RepID=A0A1H6IYZ4_9EURY|nr:hypothetical protein [Halopenitus malekzadehii]SEH54709.1 hypothetical protein SAMN05192561_1062 [Halopenitus malekzadehii]